MSYIYIAGPFFNEAQVGFVKDIEDCLAMSGIDYYSPRSEGVLIAQTEEEKQKNKKNIYDTNVNRISDCDKVLAIIDDRDIGTIWEMGYATGLGIPVVTISNQSYGLNVMLAESVQAHVLNVIDAIRAIEDDNYTGEIIRGVY